MDAREIVSNPSEPGAVSSTRSSCPHCGAGHDYAVVGLTWDRDEQAWRCLLCGHRTFPHPRPSPAQVKEELLWERLIQADEGPDQHRHEELDEWEEEVGEGAPASSSAGLLTWLTKRSAERGPRINPVAHRHGRR